MTIQEAKDEIARLKPQDDLLYRRYTDADNAAKKVGQEWCEVSRRIEKLELFVETMEEHNAN